MGPGRIASPAAIPAIPFSRWNQGSDARPGVNPGPIIWKMRTGHQRPELAVGPGAYPELLGNLTKSFDELHRELLLNCN